MSDTKLIEIIENAFDNRAAISASSVDANVRAAINDVIAGLDDGSLRVAEKIDGEWVTNQWIKKAVLLSFRIQDNFVTEAPGGAFYDKVPLKFDGYTADRFAKEGLRVVPGAVVRRGSYIEPNAVLMPSFVNIGARVGSGTMVDTWATVGSCAQIGAHVHLSGGVGIGGVLEPVVANPVIVEDHCFIGSRCIIVEGVHIGREAVLGANVCLTQSTRIIDVSGPEAKEYRGWVPPRSVVIPGSMPKQFPAGIYHVPCALIIGKRKESTDRKTTLNEALRDFNVAV